MSRFVRQSKVRHVFANEPKPEECFHNFKLSTATGDHNYIKGNSLYFGVPISSGGGALTIVSYAAHGSKADAQPPVLDGHKGPVLDFEFSPFHDSLIATGGDDGKAMIWGIPQGGLTKSLTADDALVTMVGHQKKITVMRYHPSADHVLATGSADQSIKLWDAEQGAEKVNIDVEGSGNIILDLQWNYDGSNLLSSSKDKMVRVIDPRSGAVASSVEAHDGTKTCKVENLGKTGRFCTVGFTRQSKRQLKIWDYKKLDKEVAVLDIDQAAGVMMPFYDEDLNMLYIAGKGDGNVRYYELVDEDPWVFYISEFKTNTPQRGVAMLPKRVVQAIHPSGCEVSRMLKLTNNSVEPIKFICPRKSDLFQADLFPDARSGVAANTAAAFFDGTNKAPNLMSMDPKKRTDNPGGGEGPAIAKQKSPAELQKELDTANKKIKELEELLKKNNISF